MHFCPTAGVGPVKVAYTEDVEDLRDLYDGITGLAANGGGDLPEYALSGMLAGLTATSDIFGDITEVMTYGSQMVVITDALSKLPGLRDEVIMQANVRGVCIHFFLSGNPTSDGIYQQIATDTSGTLLNSFNYFSLASFTAMYKTNPCGGGSRMKRAAATVSATARCQSFTVTKFAFLLKLSIGAPAGTSVAINDPTGGTETVVTATGDFAVFSKVDPPSGTWTVCPRGDVMVTTSMSQSLSIDTAVVYINKERESTSSVPPACELPNYFHLHVQTAYFQ